MSLLNTWISWYRRSNGDSGLIEIAEPAFSLRRPNTSSLKRVKVGCPGEDQTRSKDAQVCTDLPADMSADTGFCVVVEKKGPLFENTESSLTDNVPSNNSMTITNTNNSNDNSINIYSCAIKLIKPKMC
ncbi:hypothetical protein PoB_007256600 [Plakobranchus ocellatus]|uniref:Uncharacterized protein n=1 Tax=Plakobranchus ocellatus TaxID=259542 RepID=A0AAV4DQ85_9GAST|nr:hypothetical protein PoB_007256600 [Plakobranchus ocellatus]